jgi:hypothetical protein
MKIVVKMVPLPAMLGVAQNTWMAFAITADATKVTPRRIKFRKCLSEPRRRQMRRRDFIKGIAGSATAWPLVARATDRLPRIGVLMGYPEGDLEAQSYITAFLEGLRTLAGAAKPAKSLAGNCAK